MFTHSSDIWLLIHTYPSTQMPYYWWLLYSSDFKQYKRIMDYLVDAYIIDINGVNRQGSYRFPYYSREIKTTDVLTIAWYYMQT